MPKLYYTATSCGAASFIAAHTAGIKLDTEQVDIRAHQTASGADYYTINPKGNVPALILDDGTILNENAAVLQYIADLTPGRIAPANGEQSRYNLQNILSYIGSEVHPSIGGLFNPTIGEEVKAFIKGNAAKKLTYLENHLIGDKSFLVGDSFTVADSYLYIVLSWTQYVGVDLSPYPKVTAYFERIASLDNVKSAHERIATSPATTI